MTAVPTRRPMAQPTSDTRPILCRRGNQHGHAEWSTAHAPARGDGRQRGTNAHGGGSGRQPEPALAAPGGEHRAAGFRRHPMTEPVALGSLAVVRLVGALHSLLLDRKGVGPPQRLMRSRALSCSIDAPRCAPWLNGRRDTRSGRSGARNEDLALSRLEGTAPERSKSPGGPVDDSSVHPDQGACAAHRGQW